MSKRIHRSQSQVRSPCEIDCVTHDKVPVLLKKQTDWSIDKLSSKTCLNFLSCIYFNSLP